MIRKATKTNTNHEVSEEFKKLLLKADTYAETHASDDAILWLAKRLSYKKLGFSFTYEIKVGLDNSAWLFIKPYAPCNKYDEHIVNEYRDLGERDTITIYSGSDYILWGNSSDEIDEYESPSNIVAAGGKLLF